MQTVRINLEPLPYNVRVGTGLLAQAGSLLREISKSDRVAILTDDHILPLHLPALEQSLRDAGFRSVVTSIPPGEKHKSLESLLPVYDRFLSDRIERSTPVIALGGGIVGDMAGFVAATLLRGVPFVQIPTTLLAMVDASVGGKTGVNHAVGKNLIGAFHQPIVVIADTAVLKTLPRSQFISGLAECIKHEIIRDADGFTRLEENLPAILALNSGELNDLVFHNVSIKAAVVEADPHEHGVRAHLNFGHTFGHAIERVCDYTLSHGECVSIGMTIACDLAVELNMLDRPAADRITQLITRAGLPTSTTLDPAAVYKAMSFDKKVQSSRINLILPDRIGNVVIRDDIPPAMIEAALRRVLRR